MRSDYAEGRAYMRVVFFQIKFTQQKLQKIIEVTKRHFLQKENFLIVTGEEKSASYVDDLLWKYSPSSFLPHSIDTQLSQDKIVITYKRENLNQASYVFNLCPNALVLEEPKVIYEFEDLSQPGKQILSRKKCAFYREKKYFIETMLA